MQTCLDTRYTLLDLVFVCNGGNEIMNLEYNVGITLSGAPISALYDFTNHCHMTVHASM